MTGNHAAKGLADLLERAADLYGSHDAVEASGETLSYSELAAAARDTACGLLAHGLSAGARVAVYLPKQIETIVSLFAICAAGGVFVPVNPLLKAQQVGHILRDCGAEMLITSPERAALLKSILTATPTLRRLILVSRSHQSSTSPDGASLHFDQLRTHQSHSSLPPVSHHGLAALLYTSGSTGQPKGVMLSHQNILSGARSVAGYLRNTASDRILVVLPLSFDYGLSQITTACYAGGCAVLMDYLLPRDVIRAVATQGITGLAGVPALWHSLAPLPWPEEARRNLRYLTNSGGVLSVSVIEQLRTKLPTTNIFLMYGLTEAFRSTYLEPDQVDHRPTSIGKAIPENQVGVFRHDGTPCRPGEPGELVHRGPTVAMGYWNNVEATRRRFRPWPGPNAPGHAAETAVWSGDTAYTDEQGYFYFVGRQDDMIKTAGYRISPSEIEDVAYQAAPLGQAVALGVPHPDLGQAIVLVVTARQTGEAIDPAALLNQFRRLLPNYMVPAEILQVPSLPYTLNGKIDRHQLTADIAARHPHIASP